MSILCCYDNNKLEPDALKSFRRYAPDVEMVNCTGNWSSRESLAESQTHYWGELRACWRGQEDLVVLKQRYELKAATLDTFANCDALVCKRDGHTRYSAELQRKIPHATIAGDYCVWHILEDRMAMVWAIYKIEVCSHNYDPPIRELYDPQELMKTGRPEGHL